MSSFPPFGVHSDYFTGRRLDSETKNGYPYLGRCAKTAGASVRKKRRTDEFACAGGYRVCLEIGRRAHFPLRQARLVTLARVSQEKENSPAAFKDTRVRPSRRRTVDEETRFSSSSRYWMNECCVLRSVSAYFVVKDSSAYYLSSTLLGTSVRLLKSLWRVRSRQEEEACYFFVRYVVNFPNFDGTQFKFIGCFQLPQQTVLDLNI